MSSQPSPRIYLDNAATSWPKPEAVYAACDQYLRNLGAPAGRSTYREALAAQRMVDDCRRSLALLLEVDENRRIIFTSNGTDSLNLAIHGLLEAGDHVVTTVCEHNSVLRPLRDAQQRLGVEVTRVGCGSDGVLSAADILAALKDNTRLVAVTHASNVTGAIQPVAEVGRTLRNHAALLLVDAAQSLGHLRVAPDELGADLLAAPGHKGLLGPLGTGILYVGPRAEPLLRSVRQGGTGSQSEVDRQPDPLPDRLESGNHNLPGIAGLGAAVDFLLERGLESIRRHEQELTSQFVDGLSGIPGVRILGPQTAEARVGVVSIQIDGYDPHEAAAMLDALGVQVRAGLHCAPLMHRALGTLVDRDDEQVAKSSSGSGTLRFSLGPFNTPQDVRAAVDGVAQIVDASVSSDSRGAS